MYQSNKLARRWEAYSAISSTEPLIRPFWASRLDRTKKLIFRFLSYFIEKLPVFACYFYLFFGVCFCSAPEIASASFGKLSFQAVSWTRFSRVEWCSMNTQKMLWAAQNKTLNGSGRHTTNLFRSLSWLFFSFFASRNRKWMWKS